MCVILLAKVLVKKRDLALRTLAQHAPPGMRWTVPSGGLNIWITLPERLPAEDVLLATRQKGIVFLLGSLCFPGEPEFHHLRISFAHVQEADLQRAVISLCETVAACLQRPRDVYGTEPVL